MSGTTKLCEGCFRTLDEIASWGGMSDPERRLVTHSIAERKKALESGAPYAVPLGGLRNPSAPSKH
jgi:uncharacterized protein